MKVEKEMIDELLTNPKVLKALADLMKPLRSKDDKLIIKISGKKE